MVINHQYRESNFSNDLIRDVYLTIPKGIPWFSDKSHRISPNGLKKFYLNLMYEVSLSI